MIKTLWQSEPSPKQLRQFSITLGLIFLVGLIWSQVKENQILAGFFLVLLIFLLMGWLWRPLLIFFYRLWMSLSHLLGALMSRIILTLIFFLIFTPIGLILKVIGKQPLDLKIEKEKLGYWHQRKKRQSDLDKMY